jgi:hypothetical protein
MVRFHPRSPMEDKKDNIKKDNSWWKPVLIFYAKTTSWIIFPLLLAVVISKNIAPSLYLLFVLIGFGITCFGIYKEIKEYKKDLKKEEEDKNNKI